MVFIVNTVTLFLFPAQLQIPSGSSREILTTLRKSVNYLTYAV